MRAFTPYNLEEMQLRALKKKLETYGSVNCSLSELNELHTLWFRRNFPMEKINLKQTYSNEMRVIEFAVFLVKQNI